MNASQIFKHTSIVVAVGLAFWSGQGAAAPNQGTNGLETHDQINQPIDGQVTVTYPYSMVKRFHPDTVATIFIDDLYLGNADEAAKLIGTPFNVVDSEKVQEAGRLALVAKAHVLSQSLAKPGLSQPSMALPEYIGDSKAIITVLARLVGKEHDKSWDNAYDVTLYRRDEKWVVVGWRSMRAKK